MQLILETEAAPDLDIKMTSLETKDVQEFSKSADGSKKVVLDIENGQNEGAEIANDNTQETTNGNKTSESNTNEENCGSEELSTNGDNKVKDVTEKNNSDNNLLHDETERISKSGSPAENNGTEIQNETDVTDNKKEITESKDCIKTGSVLESKCNTNTSASENCDNANSNNDCADVIEPKQSHSTEDPEVVVENKKDTSISEEASVEVQNTEDIVSSDKEMPTNDDVNTSNGMNEQAKKTNCALETDLIQNDDKNELDNNLKETNDCEHSLTCSPKNVDESMEVDLCADDAIVDKCNLKENVTQNTDVVEVIETVVDENIEKQNNEDVMEDKSLENQQNPNDSEADIDCVEIKDDSDEGPAKSTKQKSEEVTNTNVVKRNTLMTLSNTLDILSDDDGDTEENNKTESNGSAENSNPSNNDASANSKCINIDDDDDVMVIDDESTLKVLDDPKDTNVETSSEIVNEHQAEKVVLQTSDIEKQEEKLENDLESSSDAPDAASSIKDVPEIIAESPKVSEKLEAENNEIPKIESKPLIPDSFLKTFKTKVSEMTRDDLEEFCLLKIVEGIIDKSGLSEIKTKLKNLSQNVEEWKKKALMLTKQNKDLKIVLKAVQEEQRKRADVAVVPLKITRSVGMQVFMSDNADRSNVRRKQNPTQIPPQRNNKTAIMPKPVNKQTSNMGQIPVPRLVPAANNCPVKPKTPSQIQNYTVSSNTRQVNTTPNGVKKSPSLPQKSEKRSFSQMQQQHQSVTVDLTDDEPPSKQQTTSKNVSQSPVRLVSPQQLLTPRAQMSHGINGPRNVYIPINSTGSPSIRPGQAIMLKSVPGSRVRGNLVRLPPNTVRLPRANGHRHPAPLPEVDKQQQPPNWKAIPPAPDLKISKVENGIVVSWKIEDYQEDSYEEIASYQLFAYQESNSPPDSTNWKKIGDVKALPLPMACTLTQFMAGFKYFFAVRAVDIRSRFGPFSLPGSILLLNK